MACCIEMSELSLYQVCLKAVVFYVKEGSWRSCSVNPFSGLPTKIVDDVLEAGKGNFKSLSQIFVLLTSGSYTRLDLRPYYTDRELCVVHHIIKRNGFRSLRYLAWSTGGTIAQSLITTVIRSSPKLEEFHAGTMVDLEAFQNCKELKVLKLKGSFGLIRSMDVSVCVSSLSSRRSLQVLDSDEGDDDVAAAILEYCPQLISAGSNDSLNTLEKIRDSTNIPAHFNLKMCRWGRNAYALNKMPFNEYRSYKSSFREKVRNAVSLCPFVEKLIIYVSHSKSLESLKKLKHLTYLKISFSECDDYYMARLISLLQVIGERLKHLTFSDDRIEVMQVEMIFNLCPHLESLEIGRSIKFKEPLKPVCNVKLKRLHIMKADRHALWFLLSSCKAIEELIVEYAPCLEDAFLIEVLKLNLLERLKICNIHKTNLSHDAIVLFYRLAVSLEERYIGVNDYLDQWLLEGLHAMYPIKHRTIDRSFTVFD